MDVSDADLISRSRSGDLTAFDALMARYQATGSTDPDVIGQITALTVLKERQAKSIAEGVPGARVVMLPASNHHIFLSNEADVLREMRAFLGRL